VAGLSLAVGDIEELESHARRLARRLRIVLISDERNATSRRNHDVGPRHLDGQTNHGILRQKTDGFYEDAAARDIFSGEPVGVQRRGTDAERSLDPLVLALVSLASFGHGTGHL